MINFFYVNIKKFYTYHVNDDDVVIVDDGRPDLRPSAILDPYTPPDLRLPAILDPHTPPDLRLPAPLGPYTPPDPRILTPQGASDPSDPQILAPQGLQIPDPGPPGAPDPRSQIPDPPLGPVTARGCSPSPRAWGLWGSWGEGGPATPRRYLIILQFGTPRRSPPGRILGYRAVLGVYPSLPKEPWCNFGGISRKTLKTPDPENPGFSLPRAPRPPRPPRVPGLRGGSPPAAPQGSPGSSKIDGFSIPPELPQELQNRPFWSPPGSGPAPGSGSAGLPVWPDPADPAPERSPSDRRTPSGDAIRPSRPDYVLSLRCWRFANAPSARANAQRGHVRALHTLVLSEYGGTPTSQSQRSANGRCDRVSKSSFANAQCRYTLLL